MLVTFLVLAGLGAGLVVGGVAAMLRTSGKTERVSGEEIGEDVVRRQTRDTPEENPLAEAAVFRGEGAGVRRTASTSFGDIKADLRAGNYRRGLPPFLAFVGLIVLLVSGSLALLVGLESPLPGAVMLAAVVLTLGRQVVWFVKA
jgi:hypothetical protein